MIAIKGIKMPKNCIECNHLNLQEALGCQLIYSGCANCGRHPDCPLVEIVTCKDCKYYREDDDTGHCTNHTCGDVIFWCHADYYCADAERGE